MADKTTVCILYGFCEGPRMARRTLRLLEDTGYRITQSVRNADIVIAHSGGCFLVPDDLPSTTWVMMIGVTHWPGKSIIRALLEKNWNDFRLHRGDRSVPTWLRKFSWNLVYFWNLAHSLSMLRARRRGGFWQAKHVTLVRNQEDSFCTPDIASLPFIHQPKYVELPGQHDDIWLHPDRYVAIMNDDAARLLAQAGK